MLAGGVEVRSTYELVGAFEWSIFSIFLVIVVSDFSLRYFNWIFRNRLVGLSDF